MNAAQVIMARTSRLEYLLANLFMRPSLQQSHGNTAMPADIRRGGELKMNEPMARHVSWRAGGAADRAYFPAGLDDLAAFLKRLPPAEAVHFVGLGSNLLVRDGGLRGTVVFTHRALRELRVLAAGKAAVEFYAEAGVASPKVARFAAMHGCEGAEFLAGIPGTVGGALAMNAGCYGGETWNLVTRVTTIDHSGVLRERAVSEFEIAYRSVSGPIDEWFVSAVFRIPTGDGEKSRNRIKELLAARIASQPLQQPNAGSVFRNPPGDYAARLIEARGLKGHRIGGAEISRKHANFIVNTDRASAADIEALIELARSSVRDRFGIELEPEVRIVGEHA